MDFFNSFFQNIKDKLTSPFFGTLGFVLILHHWEVWYTLFNFDKDCNRTEKLAIIRILAAEHFGRYDIIYDIICAMLFVLSGYIVVFLTRALSMTYDFRLMPWLTGKVVSKNVVLLESHKEVVKERDQYAEQYEEQRQRVRLFSRDLDEQTKQIQEKDKLILSEGEKVNQLNSSNIQLNSEIDKLNRANQELKNDIDSLETQLSVEQSLAHSANAAANDLDIRIEKLEQEIEANKQLESSYITIINDHKNKGSEQEKHIKNLESKIRELESKIQWIELKPGKGMGI